MPDIPFTFFDYEAGPVWVGNNNVETGNRSSDGGKTWAVEKRDIIFGSFFFVSEDIVVHTQNTYTFFDFLSDFGGLFHLFVLAFFYVLGEIVDDHYILIKMIRALYYTPNEN